jgi:hypothetical protein
VALGLLLALAAQVPAQDTKPLFAVSLPSYNELMADVGYLGKLSNKPDLAASIEGTLAFMTAGQGLAGMNKDKPIGAIVHFDGQAPSVIAFIPVDNLNQLLGALAGFVGQPRDAGNGILELNINQTTAYVKAQNGWAFIAREATQLGQLPADPQKLLGGLDAQYDLGVRFSMSALPDPFRQMMVQQIQAGAQAATPPRAENETDEQYEARKKLLEQQLQTVVDVVSDIDDITIGFAIDRTGQKTYLDMSVSVKEGSKTAGQFARMADVPTHFAGFVRDDALLSANMVSKVEESETASTLATLDSFRTQLLKNIEESEDFDNANQKELVKKLATRVLDLLNATLKQGMLDLGLAVVGKGPVSILAGMQVADGAEAEKVALDFVNLMKSEGDATDVQLNAATVKGVRFHTFKPIIKENPEQAAQILGSDAKVAIGVGNNRLYLGAGQDVIKSLEEIMAKSEELANQPALPVQITVALGPILKMVAEGNADNPILGMIAGTLPDDGLDHIRLFVKATSKGATYRLEAEEGVVKLLGSLGSIVAAAGGAGGF